MDPFNSSESDSRQNELISNVPQSSLETNPNLVFGPSGSNIRINESPLRRMNRQSIPRSRFEIEGEAFIDTLQDEEEPRNIKEALNCHAKENWKNAMEEEMESMKINQLWELVDPPKGRKPIGNKLILKIKRKAYGTIE